MSRQKLKRPDHLPAKNQVTDMNNVLKKLQDELWED
jgi:hypothetical protein